MKWGHCIYEVRQKSCNKIIGFKTNTVNWALVIYIEINTELQNFPIQNVYTASVFSIYFGNILYLLQIFYFGSHFLVLHEYWYVH